jgi:2-polyprenyl-3-methyl-5-hydroxy-6-metoxy-1,4-benzoquinol methylase
MIQLHVNKLSLDVSENALKEFLSQAGIVDYVEVIRDLQTGESQGYAIVWMIDEQAADEAMHQFDGTIFAGNALQISKMHLTLPGEMALRDWLHRHASEVLTAIGVKKGQTVLDYGCGRGIFSIPAARIVGEKGRVYALDVRPRALERVKESAHSAGLKNLETILQKESTVNTGFSNASMDVIIVYDVLHEFENKHELLVEMERILKPEGLLSLFPMHLGNEPMLKIMKEYGQFYLRESYFPPNCQSLSTILNFVRKE